MKRAEEWVVTALVAVMLMLSTGYMVFSGSACAVREAPILVAQTGIAVADSIAALQVATKALTDVAGLPVPAAISIQEGLLTINSRLMVLPDILRAIDRAIAAGESSDQLIDQALAVLTVAGLDLSVVIQGVPIAETTTQIVALVRAAQSAVQTVLIEVAKLKGAQ